MQKRVYKYLHFTEKRVPTNASIDFDGYSFDMFYYLTIYRFTTQTHNYGEGPEDLDTSSFPQRDEGALFLLTGSAYIHY